LSSVEKVGGTGVRIGKDMKKFTVQKSRERRRIADCVFYLKV
jgi:hypothetical protein